MVADPKHELRTLIDQLSDDDAAKTLAFARQLLDVHRAQACPPAGVPARPRAVPTLHRAPAIARIDDLRAALFGTEESVTEFDDTIRRWREEPESV
jgi:hypothetical protein